jgi:hypothetical protein
MLQQFCGVFDYVGNMEFTQEMFPDFFRLFQASVKGGYPPFARARIMLVACTVATAPKPIMAMAMAGTRSPLWQDLGTI